MLIKNNNKKIKDCNDCLFVFHHSNGAFRSSRIALNADVLLYPSAICIWTYCNCFVRRNNSDNFAFFVFKNKGKNTKKNRFKSNYKFQFDLIQVYEINNNNYYLKSSSLSIHTQLEIIDVKKIESHRKTFAFVLSHLQFLKKQ